jgi:hypothetical protein
MDVWIAIKDAHVFDGGNTVVGVSVSEEEARGMIEEWCANNAQLYHNPVRALVWEEDGRSDHVLCSTWYEGYLFFVEKHTLDLKTA